MAARVENVFFQPFRPDTAVFENTEFPLDVKDVIILLLVLLCLVCAACTIYIMIGDRTTLGVVQHLQEEDEKRSKSATGTMSMQPITEPEGKGTNATGTVSTQTVTEPEGQPKWVAIAPFKKRNRRANQSAL